MEPVQPHPPSLPSSFFPVLMVCGVIWPLEGMPHPAMQAAAWILPQTAAMQVDWGASQAWIFSISASGRTIFKKMASRAVF